MLKKKDKWHRAITNKQYIKAISHCINAMHKEIHIRINWVIKYKVQVQRHKDIHTLHGINYVSQSTYKALIGFPKCMVKKRAR